MPGEREQTEQLEARERQIVRAQGSLDTGQQNLMGAHHRGDRDHSVGDVTPSGRGPVVLRLGDGIETHAPACHASYPIRSGGGVSRSVPAQPRPRRLRGS